MLALIFSNDAKNPTSFFWISLIITYNRKESSAFYHNFVIFCGLANNNINVGNGFVILLVCHISKCISLSLTDLSIHQGLYYCCHYFLCLIQYQCCNQLKIATRVVLFFMESGNRILLSKKLHHTIKLRNIKKKLYLLPKIRIIV